MSCPAARTVHGPQGPAIVCGVLEQQNLIALGDGKSRRRGNVDATYPAGETQALAHCHGPSVTGAVTSYAGCETWQAERHRLEARERLTARTQLLQGLPAPVNRDAIEDAS